MLPTKTAVKPKEATLQILVFPFKDLHLALRLEGVQKVIQTPEIFRSGQKLLGVTHFENREAIVIDLHQKIYGCPNPQPESHLVITQASDHQLYGIPVTMLPTLIRVAVSSLHPLPTEYRDRDTLGIASHITTLSQGTAIQTLFLLDPAQLFNCPIIDNS